MDNSEMSISDKNEISIKDLDILKLCDGDVVLVRLKGSLNIGESRQLRFARYLEDKGKEMGVKFMYMPESAAMSVLRRERCP